MSEFIAEASVLIRPDTTKFRAMLEAQLAAATKGIAVPVTVAASGAAVTKAKQEIQKGVGTIPLVVGGPGAGAEAQKTAKSVSAIATANGKVAESARKTAAELATERRHMSQLERGAAATALSMGGVRGATLAASGAFLAGAAAIAIFAKALFSATKFTQQLNVFQATTSATADQMQHVSSAAKQLGADITLPGVSASDAAEAMTELAKAGLSVQDSIDGARGVLQLATAAAITNAEATQIAASALNAFGLAGNQASKVADTLANAANAAQGSIADIGLALQQAAAVGHLVGLSFQDTTVFLTALARAGLRSSDAGTSLRTTIVRLINPTKDAKAIFDKFGISVRDAQGHLRPDFFVNLGAALKSMTKEQRDATLAQIGGQDAVRALSILTGQSIGQLTGLRNELNKQGTASKVASARMQGLAGAGASLANTLQNVGIAIGQSATPAMTGLVNALTGVVQASSAAVSSVRNIGQSLGIGVPEILAAASAFVAFKIAGEGIAVLGISLARSLTAGAGAMAGLQAATRAAATGLAAFATSATGIGIILAAAAGGIALLVTREGAIEGANRRLKQSVEALGNAYEALRLAQQQAAGATRTVEQERLTVATDRLAVATARAALAQSTAGKGTIARQQLENNLAVALQNLRFAEQDLIGARADRAQADRDAAAAALAVTDAQQKEIDRTLALIEAVRRQNLVTAAQTGQAAFLSQTNDQVVAALQKRAAEEEKITGAGHQRTARQLRDLALIAQKTGQLKPITVQLLLSSTNVTEGLKQVRDNFRRTGNESAAIFVDSIIAGLVGLPPAIKTSMDEANNAARAGARQAGTDAGNQFTFGFVLAIQGIIEAAAAIGSRAGAIASAAVRRAQGQIAGAERRATRAEAGGNEQAQLEAEIERRDAARRAAALAHARRQFQKEQQFNQTVVDAQNQIDAIQNARDQRAKDAAQKRKDAADKAKQARDAADQAFLDSITTRKAGLDIAAKKARVDETKRVTDDIAANRAVIALYRRAIAQAGTMIHDTKLRAQMIREWTAAILDLQKANRDLARQAAQEKADARKAARQAKEEGLQLNIELAQARGQVKDEIKARQAYIAFLIKKARTLHLTGNALKKNLIEIANQRKAIADLRKEQKKANDDAAALQFEFLQAQQGFAGTLLSNLLPLGAIGGVVGGTVGGGGGGGVATALGTESEIAQAARRGQGATGGLAAQAQIARDKGATQGQMSSLITLTQQMVRILHRLAGDRLHPEAKNQRLRGTAQMEV